jgi:hypothetical protein
MPDLRSTVQVTYRTRKSRFRLKGASQGLAGGERGKIHRTQIPRYYIPWILKNLKVSGNTLKMARCKKS